MWLQEIEKKRNKKKTKWFTTLIGTLGGLGNEASTARDLFIHVSRMEEYKEAFDEGVRLSEFRCSRHICYAVGSQYE
jgi:hypothetical protein